MNFLQQTPFLRILLAFMLGIFLYQYISLSIGTMLILLIMSLLAVAFYEISIAKKNTQYQWRWVFGVGVFCFMVSFALIRSYISNKESDFKYFNQNNIYEVELIAAPVEKANSYMCKVELLKTLSNQHWLATDGKAILYIKKDKVVASLLYADRLLVRADFSPPDAATNPDAFDYAVYLKRQGIGATAYISAENWKKLDYSPSFSLYRMTDRSRQYLMSIFREHNIKNDEFAVLAALTLGYTDDLQPDLRQSYSASGATHILAVSGMHVAVVFAVLAFLLSFMDKNRRLKIIKVIIITIFLWAYAYITGLSPSVIRATAMFTFVAIATCLERKSLIYNTIFMSAFIILLFNPNTLFHIGFLLSYAAVLSIVFFQPFLNRFYQPKGKIQKFVWDILSISIVAQIGTMPFTFYYFHQFSNYFLLTNFLALPLSSVIIYLAIALFAVSWIPYLSTAIAYLLNITIMAMNGVIVWIHHLPYSLGQWAPNSMQFFLILACIFFFSWYLYSRKASIMMAALSCILIIGIVNITTHYKTLTTSSLIVYTGQRNTHISFIDGNKNYLFTTDSVEIERIGKTYWQNQKFLPPSDLCAEPWYNEGFVSFKGMKILILNQTFLRKKTMHQPLSIDYLIIGQGIKPKMEQILSCFSPDTVIVDKSITKWYAHSIQQKCEEHNIACHVVAEKGAFVLKTAK